MSINLCGSLVPAVLTLLVLAAGCLVTRAQPSLLPQPAKVEWGPGVGSLDAATQVIYADPAAQPEAQTLAAALRPATGFPLPVVPMPALDGKLGNALVLTLDSTLAGTLGKEGYRLEVYPTPIVRITAAAPAGLFYGGQTLRQLLPPAIFAPTVQAGAKWEIPACNIADQPRFAWRGCMLDYARHFTDVPTTKALLAALAMHKLNVFHMHLADDEGWRIEIKKYPKLTEIGAWRGSQCALPDYGQDSGTFHDPQQRYGGFFTQDQIREIVAYAATLHINVMPEIDLPGHSRALGVAYPETLPSVLPKDPKTGQPISANAISPAKESNYQVVDDIVGELANLFPFDYMHIGGDEVDHNQWSACPQIKALVAREKLGGLGGAQVYFTKRLEGILAKYKKNMIGWNEITNDRLARTTGIMSWTGTGPGYHAARMGFPVVMAPGPHAYFDMSYPEANDEPPAHWWAGAIGPERCYAFDPLGEPGLNAAQAAKIMGVQACLWTEFVHPWKTKAGWADFTTMGEVIEFKLFPRLCALAEMGWTPQAQRSYADFADRLGPVHLQRLAAAGITIRIPPPGAVVRKGAICIVPPYTGADVRYTLDGSDPLHSATAQRAGGTPIQAAAGQFRARTFLGGSVSPLHSGAAIEPAARWTREMVPSTMASHDLDITGQLDAPGIWRLRFHKTGGKHELAIQRVELLVAGQSVAQDVHDGGTHGSYRLDVPGPIPAGAKVTARVTWQALCGTEKPDTAGDLLLDPALGLEPRATVSTRIDHYGPDYAPDKLVDYDRSTFFWSSRGLHPGETLTITFATVQELSYIACPTGKPNDPAKDLLPAGTLEASVDGAIFHKIADFRNGTACATLAKEKIKAVRITVTADTGRDWVIFQDLILK